MKDIYTFKFWKHKYGPELLVDIVDYAVMLPPIPGEVWQFSPESQLKGFNLAFEREFLLTFFITPNYLNRIIRRTLGKSAKKNCRLTLI